MSAAGISDRAERRPLVALLTDFGLSDPYVGQMKAVLAKLAPRAVQIDLCHEIQPHAIAQGAFFLASSLPSLPPGALLLAVIDPGVGTARRFVCCYFAGRLVLAPDNGLFSLALDTAQVASCHDLSAAAEALPASATFHGRDRFACLAARLLNGEKPARLGPAIEPATLTRLPDLAPSLEQGQLRARVLHVDRFGNVILSAPTREFGAGATSWRQGLLNARQPFKTVRTYAELGPEELGLLDGSQGYLELALNQASAARLLQLKPGDEITLVPRFA